MSPSRLQSGTTAGGLRGRQDRLDNLVTGRWTRQKGQRICPFLWPADVARQCAFRWILLTWSEFHAQRLASLWRTLQTSIFSVFDGRRKTPQHGDDCSRRSGRLEKLITVRHSSLKRTTLPTEQTVISPTK